ncbi:MAG: ribosome biogenesis/translation initiation ATPase RLI [Candidatus Bathyarchaeia archaeon]
MAILDRERCRPKDCGLVCINFCPLVRSKVGAIQIELGNEKPTIFENLCTGCGICIRKCPFKAINIVNLPSEVEGACSYSFGRNMFKLYRLPIPRVGFITGLIGKNGIGKTTALRILSGSLRPNLGRPEDPPDWEEIIRFYRGSVLQQYFEELKAGRLKVVYKPQYVDQLPKVVSGTLGELMEKVDERGRKREVLERLELDVVHDRDIHELSGGELQRLSIAAAYCRDADVYLFDEPSSYLDVRQRIEAAKLIRTLRTEQKQIIVVEHDLAVLDYLSDYVSIMYGNPGAYGVVCHPQGVRVGINTYLDGFIPDENVRFRKEAVRFHVKPPTQEWISREVVLRWPRMRVSLGGFTLDTDKGEIYKGEVIGLLGPNGIGKTTFIKLLAGQLRPDSGDLVAQGITVSYKPQYISPEYEGTVESLLRSIVGEEVGSSRYKSEIIEPLSLERLLDRVVKELSGGELQRVAIAACLSKRADLYLVDEPSAYLDVEERMAMARTIRRSVEDRGATAFVVEHDVSAQDFIGDRIMVFSGKPGIAGLAHSPLGLREGMNTFLRIVQVTFRRDPLTGRPRVNKENSRLDRYQKSIGEYYYLKGWEEEE